MYEHCFDVNSISCDYTELNGTGYYITANMIPLIHM